MAYNQVTQQFIVNSINGDLTGLQKPISVYVEFNEYRLADHSTVSTAEASGQIEFIDPCNSALL